MEREMNLQVPDFYPLVPTSYRFILRSARLAVSLSPHSLANRLPPPPLFRGLSNWPNRSLEREWRMLQISGLL
jgi:hypothetical protein